MTRGEKWAQAFRTALIAVLLAFVFLTWGYVNFKKGFDSNYYKVIRGFLLRQWR